MVMSLGNLLEPSEPQFPRLKSEAGLLPGMEIFAPERTGNLLEQESSQRKESKQSNCEASPSRQVPGFSLTLHLEYSPF